MEVCAKSVYRRLASKGLRRNLVTPKMERHSIRKHRRLSLATWNARSINMKMEDVQHYGLRIIALTETWHQSCDACTIKRIRKPRLHCCRSSQTPLIKQVFPRQWSVDKSWQCRYNCLVWPASSQAHSRFHFQNVWRCWLQSFFGQYIIHITYCLSSGIEIPNLRLLQWIHIIIETCHVLYGLSCHSGGHEHSSGSSNWGIGLKIQQLDGGFWLCSVGGSSYWQTTWCDDFSIWPWSTRLACHWCRSHRPSTCQSIHRFYTATSFVWD